MLDVVCEDDVKDPVESENGVDQYSCVVGPGVLEPEFITKERPGSVWI